VTLILLATPSSTLRKSNSIPTCKRIVIQNGSAKKKQNKKKTRVHFGLLAAPHHFIICIAFFFVYFWIVKLICFKLGVCENAIKISDSCCVGAEGPCARHSCGHGASCVERSGMANCECPTCSSHYEPICGSDGISYGNECQLRLEGCRHRRTIQVVHSGLCSKLKSDWDRSQGCSVSYTFKTWNTSGKTSLPNSGYFQDIFCRYPSVHRRLLELVYSGLVIYPGNLR